MDNILTIKYGEWNKNTLTIDLAALLPCSKTDFKKLTSAIDLMTIYDDKQAAINQIHSFIKRNIETELEHKQRNTSAKEDSTSNAIINKWQACNAVLIDKYKVPEIETDTTKLKFKKAAIDWTAKDGKAGKNDGYIFTFDGVELGYIKASDLLNNKNYSGLFIVHIASKEVLIYVENKNMIIPKLTDTRNFDKKAIIDRIKERYSADDKEVRTDGNVTEAINKTVAAANSTKKSADSKENKETSNKPEKEEVETMKENTSKAKKTAKEITKKDVYSMITENIIAELEKGFIPWDKPWNGGKGAFNRITKKPYSLINQLLLKKSGEYATFNQWQQLGGKIKKGSKAKFVVFWKVYRKEVEAIDKETGETVKKIKAIPVLRYYNVFHIDDVENVKPLDLEKETINVSEDEIIAAAEKTKTDYIKKSGVTYWERKGNEASYNPITDRVLLPLKTQFNNINEYYGTMFHEFTHSTGIKKRLDRGLGEKLAAFGSEDYSKEELVAELGSAYILTSLGIDTPKTRKNNAAYIQSWIAALKDDNRLIISAASKAEKAAAMILGNEPETVTENN